MSKKKFYDMTDKEFIAQIKTGTIKHRRCDVCGCELSIPDIGVYSREGLNTSICPKCTPTKEHHDLLAYIEDLKQSHSKKEIIEILDQRMKDTWGNDASIFTIEEWEEQTKEERENEN